MPGLGDLTLADFSGRVGEQFTFTAVPGAPLEIRLTEAVSLGGPAFGATREPFSLIFAGPADPIVPQGVYPLAHEHLGVLELFIVPLEPAPDGARYQIIFS